MTFSWGKAVLAAGVVAIVASGCSKETATPSAPPPSSGAPKMEAQAQLAARFVAALREHKGDEADGMLCPSTTTPSRETTKALAAEDAPFTLEDNLASVAEGKLLRAVVDMSPAGQPYRGFSALIDSSAAQPCVYSVGRRAQYQQEDLDVALAIATKLAEAINKEGDGKYDRCPSMTDAEVGNLGKYFAEGKTGRVGARLPVTATDVGDGDGKSVPVDIVGTFGETNVHDRATVDVGQHCIAAFAPVATK
ncbi:hypothetical protein [Amycolatopsis sp. NPDC059657]|uniref:hypothetical protein n=1 Tax=Amycolatopsis sp. NPDC059657 TaxID=3346899 RepID=UPI00366CFF6B